jgi:outer membrane lipoprotein-sorting protein
MPNTRQEKDLRHRITLIALAISAPLFIAPVHAQEPPPAQPPAAPTAPAQDSAEEAGRARLKKITAAYAALKGLSVKVDTIGQDGDKKMEVHLTMDVQMPGKFRVKTPKGDAVSDGAYLYTHAPTTAMTYRKQSLAANEDIEMTPLKQLRDAIPGLHDAAFIDILRGDSFISEITSIPGIVTIRQEGTETIDKVTTDKVVIRTKNPDGDGAIVLTFFVGPDNLLRRISVQGKMDNNTINVVENHTILAVNPTFAADTFKFVPPPGVKEAPRPTEPPPGSANPVPTGSGNP